MRIEDSTVTVVYRINHSSGAGHRVYCDGKVHVRHDFEPENVSRATPCDCGPKVLLRDLPEDVRARFLGQRERK